MDTKSLKKILIYVSVIALFCIILSIVFSFHAIYTGVKNICIRVKTDFGENCMISLIQAIHSDNYSEKDKIHAVWALGQLAEKAAIPYLKELQKQYECVDIHKKSKMCYELHKAIKWCTNGNVTSWMYRKRHTWK